MKNNARNITCSTNDDTVIRNLEKK